MGFIGGIALRLAAVTRVQERPGFPITFNQTSRRWRGAIGPSRTGIAREARALPRHCATVSRNAAAPILRCEAGLSNRRYRRGLFPIFGFSRPGFQFLLVR
jgi:hypothetical protein